MAKQLESTELELKPKGFGVSAHIAAWEARRTESRQQDTLKKAPKEIGRARTNTDTQLKDKGRYQQSQKQTSRQQKAKKPVPSPRPPRERAPAGTQDHKMIHQQHVGQSQYRPRHDDSRQQQGSSKHQNASYVHPSNLSKDNDYLHSTEANPRPAKRQPAIQQQQHGYPHSDDHSYTTQQLPPSHVQNFNPYNLEVGSTVQFSSNPPCFGVIRWIGTVSEVQGLVAGIELEECFDGCTDGTFEPTGEKFFECCRGRGLYVPLASFFPGHSERSGVVTTHAGYSQENCGTRAQYQAVSTAFDPSHVIRQLQFENKSLVTERIALQQRIEELIQEKDQYNTHAEQQTHQLRQQIHQLQLQLDYEKQKNIQQLAEKEGENQQLKQQFATKREQLQQQNRDLQQRLDSAPKSSVAQFIKVQIPRQDQDSWNVQRREVVLQGKLGQGAWGSVCKGVFRGQQVAVKCAHENILHANTIDQLKREIQIMAHVQHPNLVRLIAAVVDEGVERGTQAPLVVLELLDMDL